MTQTTELTPQKITEIAELFAKKACNVTETCKAFGISRTIWYEWMKRPDFSTAIEESRKGLIDMVESQLIKNILAGKETSLIFFLTNRDPENWKHKNEQVLSGTVKLVQLEK